MSAIPTIDRLFRRDLAIGACLLAAMWLTRSHDVTVVALPDVSWAAFFLAGVFSHRWLLPIALTLNAFVIDYTALTNGVSDYCITPAYLFLVPTHLWLWAAGRWTEQRQGGSWADVPKFFMALSVGILGAFFISNASFYALAGYFSEMSALEYAGRVMRYLPGFFESTAIYSSIGALTGLVARSLQQMRGRKLGEHIETTRD